MVYRTIARGEFPDCFLENGQKIAVIVVVIKILFPV